MWGRKIWLFPVAVFICIPLTFIISYIIAVCNGHVAPGFPYISDTGTQAPESCIFGQLLNISAVLAGITLYIRYRDVEETLNRREITQRSCVRLSCINNIGLALGLSSALGASIVANFQETKVLVVHLIGAFMTFGLGSVYCWFQTYITYKLCGVTLRIANLRLAICVINTVFFIILVFGAVAANKFPDEDNRKWRPDDAGFAEHIVSTASEWAMALAMLVYFLTFVKEFRDFGMTCPGYYRHCDVQVTSEKIGHLSLDKGVSNHAETTCPESPESTPRNVHNESSGSLDRIITV